MHTHIFRKFIGLTVLYAVIIIGIFTIQFKSDSIIRKNIHAMRVTLAKTENSKDGATLKNQMNIACNGIQFFEDDTNPAYFTRTGSANREKAVLLSWEETSPLSCEFTFTSNILLSFSLSDETNSATLTISASLPKNVESFILNTNPYYSVVEKGARQAVLAGKNVSYALKVPQFDGNKVIFLKNAPIARYSEVSTKNDFSFSQVASLPQASAAAYRTTVSNLSSAIISDFSRSIQSNASFATSLTEQTVITYTAAMALSGRYNEALNKIPESFTRGNRRTYQSAPYFGNLSSLYSTLEMQMQNYNTLILQAISSSNPSVFTISNISDYILINKNMPAVKNLLSMPASLTDFTPTVEQAAGILSVYSKLSTNNSELVAALAPVLEPCVQIISDSCNMENDKVLISEKDSTVSVLTAAKIGQALVSYGKISSQVDVEKAGYFILNTYFADISSFDIRILSEVYPILIQDNPFYPHFVCLDSDAKTPIWAWTVARNITMNKTSSGDITLDTDFPIGLSHYMIIAGVRPFLRIQIYNINFRTDPQFEIYNSSGYVYRTNNSALLLKFRHRTQNEIVRLFYTPEEKTEEEIFDSTRNAEGEATENIAE